MKKPLINIERDERYRFHATFERYSFTSGTRGIQTLLLFNNITDPYSNPIDGGVCFDDLKCFKELGLNEGDRIAFNARVLGYIELYPDARYNCRPQKYYRLFYPTKVKKLYSIVKPLGYEEDSCPIKIPII